LVWLNQLQISSIERDWNEKARAAGAAEITIINDIDGTPPVNEDFVYYENARG